MAAQGRSDFVKYAKEIRRRSALIHITAKHRQQLLRTIPFSAEEPDMDVVKEDRNGWLSTAHGVNRRPASDGLFAMALRLLPHGVCMFTNKKTLILCNAAYAELYGLPEALTQPGTSLEAILEFRAKTGNAPADIKRYFDVIDVARVSDDDRAATRIALADGRTIQITHKELGPEGYVACHEDVSEAVQSEQHIRFLATHDSLTGLPNRAAFTEALERELMHGRRDLRFALMCLDLDQFKAVNDSLGHERGDALLRAVTERLLDCVAENDVVARVGGDEFVILQTGIMRPEEASTLAGRLVEDISRPVSLGQDTVQVGVSIGIAVYPSDGITADVLVRNADTALYRSKLDGRNTFRFFELAMDHPLQQRRRLEIDLREALVRGEFQLHYQPLVDAASGVIKGFEALLRWVHPERGSVPPLDFIPLCEERGLIGPIGEWVLDRACRDAMAWPEHLIVAVNLSPVQFRDGRLQGTVTAAIGASGLAANRLELEITESVLLIESDRTLQTLHRLRAAGVRIALDDFGTGYSSLSYLRAFPFDKIKIDRSFVNELARPDCEAIVRAVAELGAALNMVTLAEGVETEVQLERMRFHGCDELQGYLFGRPIPASEIPALLEARAGVGEPAAA